MAAESYTAGELVTMAKRLADMVNSKFISDEEWLDYIRKGVKKLYHLLIRSGMSYNESTFAITGDGSTVDHLTPDDFLGVIVATETRGSDTITLRQFHARDRARYENRVNVYSHVFRVRTSAGESSKIRVRPTLSAAETITVDYIQSTAIIDETTDVILSWDGWERIAVLHAAIQAGIKENSSVDALRHELEQETLQIREAADLQSMEPYELTLRESGETFYDWWNAS